MQKLSGFVFFVDTVYITRKYVLYVHSFKSKMTLCIVYIGVKNEHDVVRSLHATQQHNSQCRSQNTQT